MSAAPVLNIVKDGEQIKSLPVDGDILLGRGDGCVIRLDDRAISRQHALFRVVPGGVQVEKKSEFAPLSVNGVEVTRALLKDGDVIAIGPYRVEVNADRQAERAAGQVQREAFELIDSALPTPVNSTDAAPAVNLEPIAPVTETSEAKAEVEDPNKNTLELAGFDMPADALGVETPGVEDAEVKSESIEDPNTKPVDLEPFDASEMIADDAKTRVGAPTQLAVKLTFQPGAANVVEYAIEKDEVIIGRGSSCDIILNDKKASRKHSVIRRNGMSFVIKDLESGNGTYVNGVKIQEHELAGEDVIKIGAIEFKFNAVSKDYIAKEKDFMDLPDVSDLMKNKAEFTSPSQIAMALPLENQPAQVEEEFAHAPAEQPHQPGYMPQPPPWGAPGGIPGMEIPENQAQQGKRKSIIFDKFRQLSPRRQVLVSLIIILLVASFLFDEDEQIKPAPKTVKKEVVKKVGGTFEQLSPEDQEFVKSQYDLVLNFIGAKDYDGALDALMKIFSKVPDYKDARMYERYAIQGRQRAKSQAEEAQRAKLEEEQKLKIADLINEIRQRMLKKDYQGASILFGDLLSLDPENPEIATWKKEIEAWEEAQRMKAQAEQVQKEINNRGWDIYKEGLASKKEGKYYEAISYFENVLDIGATDKKLLSATKAQMAASRQLIAQRRDPFLVEAREAEAASDFGKAYRAYLKALRADPNFKETRIGLERVSKILHEKAKAMYTEAVLAESYSDFATARKRYKEILETVPEEDVYKGRAERKLSRYFGKEE